VCAIVADWWWTCGAQYRGEFRGSQPSQLERLVYESAVLVRYRRSGDLTDDSLSVFPLDWPQSEEAIATRNKKRQSLIALEDRLS